MDSYQLDKTNETNNQTSQNVQMESSDAFLNTHDNQNQNIPGQETTTTPMVDRNVDGGVIDNTVHIEMDNNDSITMECPTTNMTVHTESGSDRMDVSVPIAIQPPDGITGIHSSSHNSMQSYVEQPVTLDATATIIPSIAPSYSHSQEDTSSGTIRFDRTEVNTPTHQQHTDQHTDTCQTYTEDTLSYDHTIAYPTTDTISLSHHQDDHDPMIGTQMSSVDTQPTHLQDQQPTLEAFIGPQIPDGYIKSQSHMEANILQEPLDTKYSFSTSHPMQCVDTISSMFMTKGQENYLRGCKWSPDGTQVLTNSNDNILRTFVSNHELYAGNHTDGLKDETIPSSVIKESGIVYDFSWYPGMDQSMPETCRVACSCPGSPMHLWDSINGQLVSSYRAFDHCDEVTPAYSLSFSPDGTKLFGGYKNAIRVFDTEYCHRKCTMIKTLNPKTKEGHTGIVSCFSHGATGSNTFVTGSYSRYVGVYYSLTNELVCLIQGQQGGVTHVMISPDGNRLYTGGRKDPEIICWDMRNTGHVLSTFLRDVQTNQRMYFDLSQSGRYLVSGNHDGSVSVWDTWGQGCVVGGEVIMKPCHTFQAHADCTNGVSFNPHQPLLATSSGQRHFKDLENDDSDDDSDDGEEKKDKITARKRQDDRDFSLKIWNISCMV